MTHFHLVDHHTCEVWPSTSCQTLFLLPHLNSQVVFFTLHARITSVVPSGSLTLRAMSVWIRLNEIRSEGFCSWSDVALCVVAPEQWEAGRNWKNSPRVRRKAVSRSAAPQTSLLSEGLFQCSTYLLCFSFFFPCFPSLWCPSVVPSHVDQTRLSAGA